MNRTFKPDVAKVFFVIFLVGLLLNAGAMIFGMLSTGKAISRHEQALEKAQTEVRADNEAFIRDLQVLSVISEASFNRVLVLGQYLGANDTPINGESVDRMAYHTEDCLHQVAVDVSSVASVRENRLRSSYFGLLERERQIWETATQFFTHFDGRRQLQDQAHYRELSYSMDEFSQKLGEVNGTYSRIYASGNNAAAGAVRDQEDALESRQQTFRYYGIGLIVSLVLLAPLVWIAVRELFFSTGTGSNLEEQA